MSLPTREVFLWRKSERRIMKEQLHNCNQCAGKNEAGEKISGEFCVRFSSGTRDVFHVLGLEQAKHAFQVLTSIDNCEKRK